MHDITHTIVAAASSTSAQRATDFLKTVDAPSTAKPYGSYADFVKDPNIDIVYIATPHSHHYQNAMLCLEAGKNVLCEKAFTSNAAQTKALVAKAKEKNLFLMEAVWTRYFPLSLYVRELITSGKLGTVQRTISDLSMAMDPEGMGKEHRLLNPKLAGGALLDIGIYALTWAFQTLYHTQEKPERPSVQSSCVKYEETGVDEMTSMLLTFPRSAKAGGPAHALATCSMRVRSDPDQKGSAGPAIRVQGTKGEVCVYHPAFRPTKTKMVWQDGTVEEKDWPQPGPGKGSGWYNGFGGSKNPEGEGHGMFWEADEAARGVAEGRKEGRALGWDESVLIMEIMDQVREQNGLKFPEEIETTKYPVDL